MPIGRLRLVFYITALCCVGIKQANAQWTALKTDTNISYWDIHIHSNEELVLVGNRYSKSDPRRGIVEYTGDGGKTWNTTEIKYPGSQYSPNIFCTEFINQDIGFIAGTDGNFYKTENRGKDWEHFFWFGWNDILGMRLVQDSILYVNDGKLGVLHKTDSSIVLGPGFGIKDYISSFTLFSGSSGLFSTRRFRDSSFIYLFSNYGKTAEIVFRGKHDISHFNFKDSLLGYAVGADGFFSKTVDGGKTWSTPVLMGPERLYGVDFVNDTLGFAVGGCDNIWGTPPCSGALYKTIDGGVKWTIEFDTERSFKAVVFPSDSIGYIIGHQGQVYKTTTMGLSAPDTRRISTIGIFPNPNTGAFSINTKNLNIDHLDDLRIFNTVGKELTYSAQLEGDYIHISLNPEFRGVGFVKVKNSWGKFIMQ